MKKRVNENTTTINKNTTRITSTTYVYHNHLKIKKKAPHSPLSTLHRTQKGIVGNKKKYGGTGEGMEVQEKVWRCRENLPTKF